LHLSRLSLKAVKKRQFGIKILRIRGYAQLARYEVGDRLGKPMMGRRVTGHGSGFWRVFSITLFSVFVFSAVPSAVADTTPKIQLVLSSAFRAPFIELPEGGTVWPKLKQLEPTLGIEFVFVDVPAARVLVAANSGTIDGDILRVETITETHPDLVRVPFELAVVELTAFSWKPGLDINSFEQMAEMDHIVVSTQIGRKFTQKKIENYKNRLFVEKASQLFELLEQRRSDIVLLDRSTAHVIIGNRLDKTIFEVCGEPLARRKLYMFLHKKHAALVPEIYDALLAQQVAQAEVDDRQVSVTAAP